MGERVRSSKASRRAGGKLLLRTFLVILPTVVAGGLGTAYAILKSDHWEAIQGIVVRDDATGSGAAGMGKFDHSDESLAAQETIIEIARRPAVVADALKKVGPPPDAENPAAWPSLEEVEQFLDKMQVTPPKGAELGKSEILFLTVRSSSPERAKAIAAALCDATEQRYQDLRNKKATSMVAELERTVTIASEELDITTREQSSVEAEVGSNLNELRNMSSLLSNHSDLQMRATAIDSELRAAEETRRTQKELLKLLTEAQTDATRLMACPERLLASQPALERLKSGLVAAQLKKAGLNGTLAEDHPALRMADEEIDAVSRNLHAELDAAARGIESDLRVTEERIVSLSEQLTKSRESLTHLASLSARYGRLLSENKHRTEILASAERRLAEARAAAAAVRAASLISRLEEPYVGPKPAGPSRMMIAAGGILGGLFAGIGLVMLTLPTRWSVSPMGMDQTQWKVLERILQAEPQVLPRNGTHKRRRTLTVPDSSHDDSSH